MRGEVLVSSVGERDRTIVGNELELRGNEGIVIALAPEISVPRSI